MEVVFPDGVRVQVRDVIVLARKSKKVKGRAQTSIESQDEDARDWAEDQGLNVVATVPDIASGKKAMWDRPNTKPWVTQPDLMAKYQGIVSAKMDRWTRADWYLEAMIRMWAEKNHIALILVEKNLRWPPRQGEHYNDDVSAWNREAENANREWNNTSRRYKRANQQLISDNFVTGRAPYGYRLMGAICQQVPCRCYEQDKDDHKILTKHESEARIMREIVDRYLAGETLIVIASDLNRRGVPGAVFRGKTGTFSDRTLAKWLRNPALAGRRMDNYGKPESERKTIHRYEGIITWDEHLQLVARLDSRAHRTGISPANVYMLSGILADESGRSMRGHCARGGRRKHPYYYYYIPGFMIRMDLADRDINEALLDMFGDWPYLEHRIIPGGNNRDKIDRLRRDRNELDDLAEGYDEKVAAINAQIRELDRQDRDEPKPDIPKWMDTGKTIEQHWKSLTPAQRRDWLKANGWKVTAVKDPEDPRGWRLVIDAGWMAEIGLERQAESLGFPVSEYWRYLAELGEVATSIMADRQQA